MSSGWNVTDATRPNDRALDSAAASRPVEKRERLSPPWLTAAIGAGVVLALGAAHPSDEEQTRSVASQPPSELSVAYLEAWLRIEPDAPRYLDLLGQQYLGLGRWDDATRVADKLRAGLQEVFDRNDMGITVFGEGPMWHMLFTDKVPTNWREYIASDLKKLAVMEAQILKQGLFVLPQNRRFISIKHTDRDLEQTFEAMDRACHTFKTAIA